MPRDIEIPVDSVRLDLPRSPSPSALQAFYPFITTFSNLVMPHKLLCFAGSPEAVRLAHVERSGPRFTIQLCEHQLSSK
ncbi:hypothetical protein HBI42_213500 [Parastagonospora nodorum]|nr:hypothetical protein HBI43_199300 [Parastagonospora nodorum]KAH6243752.1 hypothetical protein HBI42_213500 [Parastagonospora nodorum]